MNGLKIRGKVTGGAEGGNKLYSSETCETVVAKGDLPKRVDLRKWMTPVEAQGVSNSCCANAVAGAYEYLCTRHAEKTGDTVGDISRLFVYYVGLYMNTAVGLFCVRVGLFASLSVTMSVSTPDPYTHTGRLVEAQEWNEEHLPMEVCMYVCMYMYMYIVYVYVYVYVVCMYVHTYILCMYACMHTCMYAYMHTCIHTYIHTYIQSFIHTYIQDAGMTVDSTTVV